MPRPGYILALLFAASFTLATVIEPWHAQWEGSLSRSGDFLTVLLGDGRKVFAGYFYRKADVYFHAGFYPSIFDQAAREEAGHHLSEISMPGDADHDHDHAHDHDHDHGHHHDHGHDHDHDWGPGPPRDWIDRFGRYFRPSRHVHLETAAELGEVLPWLRISVDLDPQQIQAYTVGAYWLRRHLGRVTEAEQFLREGLRANPRSYEILFELGRLYAEDREDSTRARNVWELALQYWDEQMNTEPEPDLLAYRQIVGNLARLDEQEGNLARALAWWQAVHERLPGVEAIQKQIEELSARLAAEGQQLEP